MLQAHDLRFSRSLLCLDCNFYLIQSSLLFTFNLSHSLFKQLLGSLQLFLLVVSGLRDDGLCIHQPVAHIIHLLVQSCLLLLFLLLCLVQEVLNLHIQSLHLSWDRIPLSLTKRPSFTHVLHPGSVGLSLRIQFHYLLRFNFCTRLPHSLQLLFQPLLLCLYFVRLAHTHRQFRQIQFHPIECLACSIHLFGMQSCTIQYLLLVYDLSDVLFPTCHMAVQPLVERTFRTLEHLIQFGNLRLYLFHLLSLSLQFCLCFRLYVLYNSFIFSLQLLQVGIQTSDVASQFHLLLLQLNLLSQMQIHHILVRSIEQQSVQALLTLLSLQFDAIYLALRNS